MDGNSPQTLLQDLQLRMRIIDSDVDKRRAKKQAAEAARRLWLELEEPGDLIDRIIYSVRRIVWPTAEMCGRRQRLTLF